MENIFFEKGSLITSVFECNVGTQNILYEIINRTLGARSCVNIIFAMVDVFKYIWIVIGCLQRAQVNANVDHSSASSRSLDELPQNGTTCVYPPYLIRPYRTAGMNAHHVIHRIFNESRLRLQASSAVSQVN